MNQISTSNPAPPTGIAPTEVPLGITSTTSVSGGPVNKAQNSTPCFSLQEGIYYGQFNISSSQAPGTIVFAWSSLHPLGDFPNRYNTIASGTNTRFLVPWELMTAFYSRQCKIDWELVFTAVKVSDCRVSFDVAFHYDSYPFGGDQTRFNHNDSYHKVMDSQDDNFTVPIPMYWISNNVNTDTYRTNFNTANPLTVQPASLPSTYMNIMIRNPYYPNLNQPDDFTIVVTARPIVRQAIGIAGKSVIRTFNPTLDDQIPRPYFFNKS